MCTITHQKHHTQSGRSKKVHCTFSIHSAYNNVFTKEPIRELEIKLECMNVIYNRGTASQKGAVPP